MVLHWYRTGKNGWTPWRVGNWNHVSIKRPFYEFGWSRKSALAWDTGVFLYYNLLAQGENLVYAEKVLQLTFLKNPCFSHLEEWFGEEFTGECRVFQENLRISSFRTREFLVFFRKVRVLKKENKKILFSKNKPKNSRKKAKTSCFAKNCLGVKSGLQQGLFKQVSHSWFF